jgi:bifunctional non-homologous end joining protein LigD
VPAGVRVETIAANGDRQRRVVGGDLLTLLYVIQLGCVSVDPWHSRVPSLDFADYTILDLDPGKDATFRDVVPVARWVKEVLDEYHLHAAVKTSGARGIHVYLPLPRQISNDRAKRLAQEVATEVVRRHPKETTITRSVSARKSTAVYVDYLQNDRGKSVAGPYCVRAKPGASVATPLAWEELTKALDPRRWTIETALTRFADVGDLWHEAMRRPNTVRAIRAFERAREA